MNKAICLVLAVLVLVFACSLPGYAHGAGYGRGGGWHGGGGGWHGGLWIGPGWGWDPWWWGAPGYPYYPYYPYYSDPAVIQHQPQEYIQRAPQQEQQYYWYFCPDSKNYYPYVKRCPSGWLRVVPPQAPPPQPPLPPQPLPPAARVIDRLTIHVNFDFDKSTIRKTDETELQKAIDFVRKYPDANVELEGHTDGKGTEQYNQKLSERRAEAVRQYLINQGVVDKARISARCYGKSRPIAPNKTKDGKDNPEGRAENRRVEILIISK